MRNKRTEHPKVTGTSDLDYIWIKIPHEADHFSIVSPEHKVVFVRAIKRKGEKTAGKLDRGTGTRDHNFFASTGVDD